MKAIHSSLLFVLALSASPVAIAADSMLRVTCEGDDVGAEVLVNGKFRGECPVDVQVPAGTLTLQVLKKVDDQRERVFEQEIRMGDGSVKKVEAVLTMRLNAAAQKREDEHIRLVREANARAYAEQQRLTEEKHRSDEEAERVRVAQATQMLETLKQQGIEPANGKSFRDCPECPEMVLIPAGSFDMGLEHIEDDRYDYPDEKPVHRVTIAQVFAIGKTEVTQGQWRAVMGNNPSYFSDCGDNCPVEKVSWNDAQSFIQKLNAKTGKHYRLPTEAEWEYSCRAGLHQMYCGSNDDNVGWHVHNSGSLFSDGHTHPVGQKQANAFGLYDMSGNVWEWVEDSYHDSYNGAPIDGSVWQGDGAKRVRRGGGWFWVPRDTRAAYRGEDEPAKRGNDLGFRLARMLP